MKRAVISAALLMFVGLGTTVVGGPEPGENEMAITGVSGSAEATTGVGPEGKKYRHRLDNLNRSCLTENQSTGVEFKGFEDRGNFTRVDFSGIVETPTPGYEAHLNLTEESENSYRLDIVESDLGGTGVTCIGAVEFKGYFAAKEDFNLKVFHEGDKIFDDSTRGYTETGENSGTASSGLWSVLSEIFGALF